MKNLKRTNPHRRSILSGVFALSKACLIVIVLAAALASVTNAQTAAASGSATINVAPATAAPTQVLPAKPPSNETAPADPAKSYADSLKQLAALYEQDAQKLAEENAKLKQLFAEGLIARVEVEKSDQSLADARARVETTQNQIAEANRKPAPLLNAAAAPANGSTNESWTTGNTTVDNLIRYNGKQNGVDPYLIFCLMHQESGFASRVTSPKGAQGLMQLMPGTAARYGVTNPFDAAQSISAGARYLKDLLQMFNGRLDLALAGYNAGEGAVVKYGYQIPPYSETQNYVRLITMRYVKKDGVSKKI